MSLLPVISKIKKKRIKKERKDNIFLDFFAEFSLTLVLEIIINIIWNVLLFIPRILIRGLSNLF